MVVGGARHGQRRVQRAAGGAQKLVRPRLHGRLSGVKGAFQPRLGVGALAEEGVEAQRQIAHLVRAAPGVEAGKRFAAFLVEGVHGLVRRLVQQARILGVVEYAEGGVHARGLEVGAQKLGAEAVQRADGSAVQTEHLLAQARVALRGRFAQAGGEALAHLGGGGAREGDHQHAAHVRPLLDEGEHALHEHRGLARARRRAQKQIRAARFNGAALFFSKLHSLSLSAPACNRASLPRPWLPV